MLRIAVAGASGRMGRMLVEAVLASDDCLLAGALDVAGSPALGQDNRLIYGEWLGLDADEIERLTAAGVL